MARFTITGDSRMGKIRDRTERTIIGMTYVTILCRWQMACRFHRIRIVSNKLAGMTAFAATGEARVNRAQEI